MIKDKILKYSGLELLKEEKKPRKKNRRKKETVKLRDLLEGLLLESVDMSNGEKIIRALERGQVPDVKKKVFLNTNLKEDSIIQTLNNVANTMKSAVPTDRYNSHMFLLLKKAQNIEVLNRFSNSQLNELIDTIMAYFNNINKKEVKEEEQTKKAFENFANSPLDLEKDKKFENWASEKFAQKAKTKDGDIKEIYSDKDGWTVSIPRTFAAANVLARMGNRKANWCTAARSDLFRKHSSPRNPLYIIRNENKNVMYQMDWGKSGDPDFTNEKNFTASLKEVEEYNIPDALLGIIKNNDGKSVLDFLNELGDRIKRTKKSSEKRVEEIKKITDWKVEEITIEEMNKILGENNNKEFRIFIPPSLKNPDGTDMDSSSRMDSILSGRAFTDVYKLTGDEGKRIIYGIKGKVQYFIKSGRKEEANVFVEVENGDVKLLDKFAILGGDVNLPESLIKKFKDIDIKKVKEVRNQKIEREEEFYFLKDLSQIHQMRDKFKDDFVFRSFFERLNKKQALKNIYIDINDEEILALWFSKVEEAFDGITFYRADNKTVFSKYKANEKAFKLPKETLEKIIGDNIDDEYTKKAMKEVYVNKNFVVPIVNGEYYFDIQNNNLLDKNKEVITAITKITPFYNRLKKEDVEKYETIRDEIEAVRHAKSYSKNYLEAMERGYSGEPSVEDFQNNKKLRQKLENEKELLSSDRGKYRSISKDYSELRINMIDNILNSKGKRIILGDFTISVRSPNFSTEKIDGSLIYDAEMSRQGASLYFEEKGGKRRAIKILRTRHAGNSVINPDKYSYIEDGKEVIESFSGYTVESPKVENLVKYFLKSIKKI